MESILVLLSLAGEGSRMPQGFPGSPAQVVLAAPSGPGSRNKGPAGHEVTQAELNPHSLVLDCIPFKNRRRLQNNHHRNLFASHPHSWDE